MLIIIINWLTNECDDARCKILVVSDVTGKHVPVTSVEGSLILEDLGLFFFSKFDF